MIKDYCEKNCVGYKETHTCFLDDECNACKTYRNNNTASFLSRQVTSDVILTCLNEICYTDADGNIIQDVINSTVIITYYDVIRYLKNTYGICFSIQYDNKYYYVITEGIDADADIYNNIRSLQMLSKESAYTVTLMLILTDLNWRHKYKRNFSSIK